MLTHLSLFSGIGGIDLAAEWAGFKTIAFCEIDPYCQKVLRKHWPNTPIIGDIHDIKGQDYKGIELISGGFPCQDVSDAGRKAGIEGSRSGLWFEYARIISEARPKFVLVENVSGLLDRGFSEVLGTLAAIGYDAEWDCIPASFVGAPHQRERVFLVAYPMQIGRRNGKRHYTKYEIRRNEKWGITENFKSGGEWKRWLNEVSEAVDGEISSSDFHRVDDGLSQDLDRLKCLGNAVVPQQVYPVLKAIADIENSSK